MNRPETTEYDPYYEHYVSLVSGDLLPFLDAQSRDLAALIEPLPEEKGTHSYADGKWTIKELLSHLIDGERMFAYRTLRVSRGDETPIEGFEQDPYIEHSHANERSFSDLLKEFSLLREANMLMLRNMKDDDWLRIGTANQRRISARALSWIMGGHVAHHVEVLKERYL
ncbi:MAG: DinB family protein [Acidobacteria bacterium]|nr:DinB family protein [Acidobacteriota bacterium]